MLKDLVQYDENLQVSITKLRYSVFDNVVNSYNIGPVDFTSSIPSALYMLPILTLI